MAIHLSYIFLTIYKILQFSYNIHFPQVSSFGEFLCPTCLQVPSQDTQWPMTPPIMFGEFTTCSCESSMLQFIQHILPRNLHLAFTLHDSILERAQKKLNGYLSEFLLHLYFFGELELFLVVKATLVIIKYYFDESCFRLTKSSSNISWRISCCCLMKSITWLN